MVFLSFLVVFVVFRRYSGMGSIFGEHDQYTAAFCLFLILTAYSLYFVQQYVPETKGLSLLEIESLFKGENLESSSLCCCGSNSSRSSTHQRGSGSIARSLNAESPVSQRHPARSMDSGVSKTTSATSEATYDRMA